MGWTALSFAGLAVAFGVPPPAVDPPSSIGDVMMLGAAAAWAATTLVIKATRNRSRPEKTLVYQLVVSVPMLALAALLFGEHMSGSRRRWRSAGSPSSRPSSA